MMAQSSRKGPAGARRRVALLALAMLVACESEGVGPGRQASLSFQVSAADGFTSTADAGRIRIVGPTTRDVPILPGETKTIDGLQPGSYSVALEGTLGGQLESFGETSVTVVAGQNRQANIVLQSFIPSFINVASETFVGQPFSIDYGSVAGATSYLVEWSTNPAFSGAQSLETTATSITMTLNDLGDYQFRVRAKNRFGSTGLASEVRAATVALAPRPPAVTSYDLVLQQSTPCPVGFRDLIVAEQVTYSDADGDFPIAPQLVEGAAAAVIESQFRFETDASFRDAYAGKTWSAVQGSGGGSGQLRTVTCWSVTDASAFLDHRVRVQDARGNWSEWTVNRVMLPRSIELTPDTVTVTAGTPKQFTAVVRDANGTVIPNVANWSNYNRAGYATIGQDGRYVLSSGVRGLDWVYAWAGNVREAVVPFGSGQGTYWMAPCWGIGPHGQGSAGPYYYYAMTVYAGREYDFHLETVPDVPSTGDADLYIRLGSQPSNQIYDAKSDGPTNLETIIWTAPDNGVVWIAIHAHSAFSGVFFGSDTTDNRCGFPGGGALPSPPAASAAAQPFADASAAEEPGWERILESSRPLDHATAPGAPAGAAARPAWPPAFRRR